MNKKRTILIAQLKAKQRMRKILEEMQNASNPGNNSGRGFGYNAPETGAVRQYDTAPANPVAFGQPDQPDIEDGNGER